MDKVLLKKEDVEMLFAWKEQHKELVRQVPCPLKSVEMVMQHNGLRIRGIRNDSKLALYVYHLHESLGKMEFEIISTHAVMLKNTTKLSLEDRQSVLTGYCALMAFMVYEQPEMVPAEEPRRIRKAHHARQQVGGKNRATYILHRRNEAAHAALGGHHASPKGIFTVRGHYRRYKSGKVVWIQEYKKGEGNKKSKIYKMGVKA